MCLNEIYDDKEFSEDKTYYKYAVRLEMGELYCPLYNTRELKTETWLNEHDYRHTLYRNKEKKINVVSELHDNIGSYKTGFHCFTEKRDAVVAAKERYRGVVLEVKVRNITSAGLDRKRETVVAEGIKITKVIERDEVHRKFAHLKD